VDRLLAVDDVGAGLEADGAALADKGDVAPAAGGLNGQTACRCVGAGIDGLLHTLAAGDLHDLLKRLVGLEYVVHKAQLLRKSDALLVDLHADAHLRADSLGHHQRRQTHRAEAGDQHRIIAVDADLLDRLIHRAEAAGNLRAVEIGQLIRQRNQILLVRKDVGRHAAVALPAVGRTVRAGAGNLVAAAAVVAHAAAGDVVNDHAVAHLEALQALARLHDNAAGLVARNGAGNVALSPLARVLAVDAADVAAADGRCLRLNQHLTVTRLRNVKFAELHRAVARKNRACHLRHKQTSLCQKYSSIL